MLTDTAIARLKWQPRPQFLADRAGLRLAAYSGGQRVWQLRTVAGVKPVTLRLGSWPQMSVRKARARATAVKEAIAHGEDPGLPARQRARITFAQFAGRWLREVVRARRKDLGSSVERMLKRDLLPRLGTLEMAGITTELIVGVVFARRDEGKTASALKLRDALKRLFDYAQVSGVVARNPVAAVDRKFIGSLTARRRALNEAELRLFFSGLRRMGRKNALALELLLLTLARKSELGLARWKHVDLERGLWEVPSETSKSGLPHMVYLAPRAIEILRELQAIGYRREAAGNGEVTVGEFYVLPSQSSATQPMTPSALNKAIGRLEWGMEHFTDHDLRRTGSTALNEKGYPADVIEKALNHSVRGIRGIYNKAQYAEQRKKMLAEWAGWLEGLKDG